MDPLLIATISLGVLTFSTSLLWVSARRGRKRARRLTTGLQGNLADAQQSVTMLRLGEREAAWAAATGTQRLDRAMVDLGKANHDVGRLERDLDDLRSRLSAADRDLDRLRTDYDESLTRVAVLEGDLDRSRLEVVEASERIPGLKQRLSSVIKERDRLSSVAQRDEHLQAELAALGRVHQELTAVREENASLRAGVDTPSLDVRIEQAHINRLQEEIDQLRNQLAEERANTRHLDPANPAPSDRVTADRLLASEAARQELEHQMTGLSAARSAEQAAAAKHISSLERLHLEIAERERRLADLEEGMAEIAMARDSAVVSVTRLEMELGELRSSHQATLDSATAETTPPATDAASYAQWDRRMREGIAESVRKATVRLETEVGHLRTVVQEKEKQLRTSPPKPNTPTPPLPIVTIRGIGPVIAGILAEHGVTTIEDVAALADPDIDRLAEIMPVYPGRIRRDDWVGQAQALLR